MKRSAILLIVSLLISIRGIYAQPKTTHNINNNSVTKTISINVPNKSIALLIDYNKGCRIKRFEVKGKNVLSKAGVYTGFSLGHGNYTSVKGENVKVTTRKNGVTLNHITFGNEIMTVNESWDIEVAGNAVIWRISRNYSDDATLEDVALPKWNFQSLQTWKGGILDNGGMVWCKYLKRINDTYGVHTGGVTFWNAETGDGLDISVNSRTGAHLSTKYSNNNGTFTSTQIASTGDLPQRYGLSRFVSERYDVFAPFRIQKGRVEVTVKLNYVDYFKRYSRGNLPGIDSVAVRELLNTTGRYGVVDNKIIGANGWLTNWKCLHEPFFAQVGLALNDANYTRNFSATLDEERNLAVASDGRVLSRWHNYPGDEMPGTYNVKTGYYEAMWGYTIDSQPGQVINTCEQFNLTGDVTWLRSQQQTMERVLNWLIKRDSNNNGIFEMKNDNISQKKASDWLDIVWASFENAFVNAQMYEALTQWAQCETLLKNGQKAKEYQVIAARLKREFNKPVEEGGFWSEKKKQYVYWRDKDGSTHGDNLVTPVNFAVIAFNICDDERRIRLILDQIEERTMKEDLFHWPLCFDSFKKEEVSPGNWPFPKYENGDIFPTWGYLGVKAYSTHNASIAIKYIQKLLAQYRKDGLSSQRYSRITQQGLGDDILAGICTSVTALYSDIYGVRPKWNRLGLEPHMSKDVDGAAFSYSLRDTTYNIKLRINDYALSSTRFEVRAHQAFGVSNKGKLFYIYQANREDKVLQITSKGTNKLILELNDQHDDALAWTMHSPDYYQFILTGYEAGAQIEVSINDKRSKIAVEANGQLKFSLASKGDTRITVKKVI